MRKSLIFKSEVFNNKLDAIKLGNEMLIELGQSAKRLGLHNNSVEWEVGIEPDAVYGQAYVSYEIKIHWVRKGQYQVRKIKRVWEKR